MNGFYLLFLLFNASFLLFFAAAEARETTTDADVGQYFYGRRVFACVDSYFDSVLRTHKTKKEEPDVCNEERLTRSGKDDDEEVHLALAYNRPTVPLYASNQYSSLIDRNGSIIVNKMATLKGGECDGDLLFVEDIEKVSKGSCDAQTGVTQVDSYPNGLALLIIKGKCESTCVGRSVNDYFPGKRNVKT